MSDPCRCELRDRAWNPFTGICETCGAKYVNHLQSIDDHAKRLRAAERAVIKAAAYVAESWRCDMPENVGNLIAAVRELRAVEAEAAKAEVQR